MLKAKQNFNEGTSSYTKKAESLSSQNHSKRADFEPDDSQIDYSDIPEWTAEDFANSKRGLFYRPNSILPKSKN